MKIIIEREKLFEMPSKYQDAFLMMSENPRLLPVVKEAFSHFAHEDDGAPMAQAAAKAALDEMSYKAIFEMIGSVNKAIGDALVPLASDKDSQ